jgi:hypothetical protein
MGNISGLTHKKYVFLFNVGIYIDVLDDDRSSVPKHLYTTVDKSMEKETRFLDPGTLGFSTVVTTFSINIRTTYIGSTTQCSFSFRYRIYLAPFVS